ncbi:Phosphate transport system regulatory protein PhoU [Parasaccharibacter apium]|uniref:Phosphate-specific transport system accessory protein PhoU n=1 Tax=Parasaccharibacter apium TaxID=1510841 RepID=A0A7U7G5K6_9PROT|nr:MULTISPECIES: phosphate signaling complex protein PhoU [Acetobacteraceae]MCL1514257.1 phosphate transport system regulatory protein PhoU [Parasaccharibacter sp. TMW 2.1891]MCQ0042183.1 phosphate signaling complex protein PhoU [Bombella sp.]MUH01913.1 phosphate signaling complex protein PhoU [Bombella sp. ESL0387]CDG33548.1 Phosphate transport system regulatory protein PhoU [Parasaccharibacter apium]
MPHERSHIVSSFEQELEQLRAMMVKIGRIVEEQVGLALRAISDHDESAAEEATRLDPEVDELEREVESLVIRLLALRSPMGADLREIVAALKITGDLERIGDYAASIARKAIKAASGDGQISLSGLRSMGRLVKENLGRTVDAVIEHDANQAMEVWHADRGVDEHYVTVFRELVTYMIEDARNIRACTELLFIAKNLERIGDHATNVAERVYYAVTGENLPTTRPRGGSPTRSLGQGEDTD